MTKKRLYQHSLSRINLNQVNDEKMNDTERPRHSEKVVPSCSLTVAARVLPQDKRYHSTEFDKLQPMVMGTSEASANFDYGQTERQRERRTRYARQTSVGEI